ncbi:MAG: glycosyltransferase family 4 protein [PVC group bacterium]
MKKVAMIFSRFPCYDEAFILRELLALERLLDLVVFSLKKSSREPVRHAVGNGLAERAIYAGLLLDRNVLGENCRLFFTRPREYLAMVFSVIRMNWRDAEFLCKSLACIPRAVYFAAVCRKRGIEHVHGQWATYPALTAFCISRINRIPFSFTGHAHDIHVKTVGLGEKLRRAAFVITCTADNKRHLLGLAPETSPDKIRIIYHGIDLENYRLKGKIAAPGRAGRPAGGEAPGDGAFHILSAGSLFECKGFEYLIDACALLAEEKFDFHCRIIGGGYLEERLKTIVREKNLESRITFTGYQAQEEMPRHYRWADIFILPAVLRIHWGIPNVLLEALAVGVPVACTPLPSLPELIDNPFCGFAIAEKDPRAIADLVKRVSGNPELLRRYGRSGRKKIEQLWDIRVTSRQIADLFSSSLIFPPEK